MKKIGYIIQFGIEVGVIFAIFIVMVVQAGVRKAFSAAPARKINDESQD